MTDPIQALHPLVERLAQRVGVARARQLHWVVTELTCYQHSVPAPDLATLLSAPHLTGFLTAADTGRLRTRTAPGRPSGIGARRVRRACLRMLATAAGLPEPTLMPAFGEPEPTWLPPLDARRALTILLAQARQPHARPVAVRTALVSCLVHYHDLRVGEIAALTLDALDLDDRTGPSLTYVPDPPGGISTRLPVTIALAEQTIEMARLWLPVRERLVAAADNADTSGRPRTRTLLVSVHGNHSGADAPGGPSRRPPGLPLHERGLTRAHVRAIADLNEVLASRHAGDPTWRPLPRTLGALRPTEDPVDAPSRPANAEAV